MREAPSAAEPDMQADLLALAFNQACLGGNLVLASSLLKRLDAVMLGSAMAWEQRESSLKLIRTMRDRLEGLRADALMEQTAGPCQPQHNIVA